MLGQAGGAGPRILPSLADALEEVEAALLADVPATSAPALLDRLRARHPGADLGRYLREVTVPPGTEVIGQGDASDFLLFLTSGMLRTELRRGDGGVVVIARCLPGALIGEIGLYGGVPRTARVVAEAPSAFLRMDAADLERMALDDPRLLADFHRMIAATLARRLGRTTALLADSELQAS